MLHVAPLVYWTSYLVRVPLFGACILTRYKIMVISVDDAWHSCMLMCLMPGVLCAGAAYCEFEAAAAGCHCQNGAQSQGAGQGVELCLPWEVCARHSFTSIDVLVGAPRMHLKSGPFCLSLWLHYVFCCACKTMPHVQATFANLSERCCHQSRHVCKLLPKRDNNISAGQTMPAT